MPLLNAYLDSLGTPSFRTGVNFAQAGCSITPAKPTSVSPFSFGLQIKQFFAFKNKVTKLLSEGTASHFVKLCGLPSNVGISSPADSQPKPSRLNNLRLERYAGEVTLFFYSCRRYAQPIHSSARLLLRGTLHVRYWAE
jgi:hypothetical protein